MTKFYPAFRAVVAVCFVFAFVSIAQAQTRTWVSGVGDDLNPCSRTAPCKTFAGAISKTATNGEINCLDPGGYGAVTITKSITIDCEDTQGSILASGTTGVIINLTANPDTQKTVRLRGISINGSGSGGQSGIRGINVSSANATPVQLFCDEIVIDNFVNEGILFNSNGGNLVVKKSSIQNNGGRGIKVDSNGATVVFASIYDTTIMRNGNGLLAEDNARVNVHDSLIAHNKANGVQAVNVSSPSVIQLERTTIANNVAAGVVAGGGVTFGTAQLSECMVTHNGTGLLINANGQIKSFGNNRVSINTVDGAFTPPNIPLL